MNRRVLCVDDEPNILQGYRRALRKDFDITIASSGTEALSILESDEPFAVVVSDMRMPGMDGVQLLLRVKDVAPDCVRMMLTGNVDQQTAIDAVNQGHIFRFLNKPCSSEDFSNALSAGIEHHRLIMAEKELLECTLNQSLQVMVDLLAMVNPFAFSRTIRVKRLVRDLAIQLGVPNLWEVEIAATLSQIGCITLPKKTLMKINDDQPLTSHEEQLYEHHPQVAYKMIARIARLNTVAMFIAHQNDLFNAPSPLIAAADNPDMIRCCAQIIKIAQDFDRLMYAGATAHEAWQTMTQREGWYAPAILNTLRILIGDDCEVEVEKMLSLSQLKPGMSFAESVRDKDGEVLFDSGTEISEPLIERLLNLIQVGIVGSEFAVRSPLHLLPKTQAMSV